MRTPTAASGDLQAEIQQLIAAGIEVTSSELTGDPVAALCRVAAGGSGCLIVIGGRLATAGAEGGIGSIGLRLLDESTWPVVIVPPGTLRPAEQRANGAAAATAMRS